MNFLWLAIGFVAASALLLSTHRRRARRERRLLAVGLVVAAVIYVGFAIVWGNPTWIALEIVGGAAYTLCAWLGLKFSPYWLAAGWAAHPAWDVLLHLYGPGRRVAPQWYAVACVSFDFLVAGYVVYRTASGATSR